MSERLTTVRLRPLIAETWRVLLGTAPALGLVWGLDWTLSVAIRVGFRIFRPPDAPFGGAPEERLAALAVAIVAQSLVAALALPVLLRQRAAVRWRGEPRFAAYMGANALLNAAIGLSSEGAQNIVRAYVVSWQAQFACALALLVTLSAMASFWMMWPLSQLSDAGPMSPGRAFRAMRGQVATYTGADLAMTLVPIVFAWLALAQFDAYQVVVPLVLGQLAATFSTAWMLTMSTVFYRRRLGLERRELGAVFE